MFILILTLRCDSTRIRNLIEIPTTSIHSVQESGIERFFVVVGWYANPRGEEINETYDVQSRVFYGPKL